MSDINDIKQVIFPEWVVKATREWFETHAQGIKERTIHDGFEVQEVRYELRNWGVKVEIYTNIGVIPLRLSKP